MSTDALIAALVGDMAPIPRQAIERRLMVATMAGFAVALVGTAMLGFNAQLVDAAFHYSLWMKLGYGFLVLLIAAGAVARLARPGGAPGRWLPLLPFALLVPAPFALSELTSAPPPAWRGMWLGRTALVCPLLIVLLSLPVLILFGWAFRAFAPTRLRLAGGFAGLAAGAVATMAYAFHCPEPAALFVGSWYSVGMLGATALGALSGPRLLRW